MTVQEHVAHARARLVRAGIAADEAGFDAEFLARQLLGWDRATYFTRRLDPAPSTFKAGFAALIERRERREPASHILGVREFWGLDFEVSSAVLTPRPETELLVEEALDWSRHHGSRVIVDVGTGSGCVAVALAHELKDARLVALDLAPAALDLARRNAARHGVAPRIAFIQSDLLSAVQDGFDLIVANLPYIPQPDAGSLQPEVRDYEPPLALFGGTDGLDPLRALIAQAVDRFTRWSALIAEFGIGQEQGIREIVARRPGVRIANVRADLQRIPRVMTIARIDRETN